MSDALDSILPGPLSEADLKVVVTLQKTELDRLLHENARLNERADKLLAMQEREQVLRQELQGLLKAAGGARPALESQAALRARADDVARRNRRLKRALKLLVAAVERER